MRTSHLVAALLAGILVGLGVWIGATVFGGGASSAPVATVERPAPTEAPPPEQAPPTLGGLDVDDLRPRLAALEARVASIESLLEEKTKQLTPVLTMLEQARAAGLLDEDGMPVGGMHPLTEMGELELGSDPSHGRGFARALAETLGLDPSRKAAMQAAVDTIFSKIEDLEKDNAKVVTDGDTTTIKIGTYDASALERDWQDWVSRNLTADERAKLEKEHAENRIFGNRLGGYERTIQIKETGGVVEISESASRDGSNVLETQMQGPALAREPMLEPYAHLLD